MVLRFDTQGKLGRVRRTPQGGLRVEAALTRTGVLRYDTPAGPRFEYRPPEEVFADASLDSLADAPVTNLHHGTVDAKNFRRVAVGALSGKAQREGDLVTGTLVIQDADTIEAIEAGTRREVSCGYTCELDPTPGVTPAGEHYDAVQKNICYNHVALVPKGRAGSQVALRLDAAGNQIGEEPHMKIKVIAGLDAAGNQIGEEPHMKIEVIAGTEYEVGTDAHRKAVKAREDAEGRAAAELATLKSERDDLAARVAKFDAEIGERVARRVELLGKAAKARVIVKADSSEAEIKRLVITKILPGFSVEGKSDDYVDGAFALAIERASTPVSAPAAKQDSAEPEKGADVVAREKMIARARAQYLKIGDKS